MSWNFLHGAQVGDQTGADSTKSTTIHSHAFDAVDLIGLQEVDYKQSRSGNIDQSAEIARMHGFSEWRFAPTIIGTPGQSWTPWKTEGTEVDSLGEKPAYGVTLFSKLPVKRWHRIELGRSWIGLPLLVGSERGLRLAYVKDEPRVALIAELENGFTVANTHLSFVPGVNIWQLRKIRKYLTGLPGEKILLGDLNLGWGLPAKVTGWSSLAAKLTYPSWKPAIQFDYILAERPLAAQPIALADPGLSYHLPVAVEIVSAT
jgi:endonuclease/exonuclease/phosphatase family metal-dependent hydrolase